MIQDTIDFIENCDYPSKIEKALEELKQDIHSIIKNYEFLSQEIFHWYGEAPSIKIEHHSC